MTSFVATRRLFVIAVAFSLAACEQKPAPPPPPQPQVQAPVAPAPPAKPKITKLDDLPRHTYPVQGSVVDLVSSADKFAVLAAQVRADTENDLATYDIEDKTTLKGLKTEILALDLIEGKNDDARKLIAELRDLEDKPALKITTGFLAEVRLDVQDQVKTTDLSDPAFQQAFQKTLTERAQALPWAIVRDELKNTKGGFEIRSKNLLLGLIKSEIDPTVKQTGALSNDLAGTVVAIRNSLLFSIPLKQPVVAALSQVITAQTKSEAAKPDIWKDRAVTLTPGDKATPVVVGIWDSGVDIKAYPDKLFNDDTPPANRDANWDPHGLAFDLHSNRVPGELYPLGDAANRVPQMKDQIKGLLDNNASIDSPEATALKDKMSKLSQDEVQPFEENLQRFENYIHGTHVAGIATAGDPFARILIARLTFDYHVIPEKPTIEQSKKDAAAYQVFVDYFKANHVRVVNMSWGGSLREVEDALEKNGVANPDDRKKQAREIFEIDKNGLLAALKSAPDILFVVAAGNSNDDVNFDEVIPSSFVLPNLATVGAVDQAGDETSFTSFGNNVTAYADGFEVDSPIPGGSHLKLSGTSMASPAFANLAAKLFALDPTLDPSGVVDLIKGGLDQNPQDKRIMLINPKKSVELLKAKQTPSTPAAG